MLDERLERTRKKVIEKFSRYITFFFDLLLMTIVLLVYGLAMAVILPIWWARLAYVRIAKKFH